LFDLVVLSGPCAGACFSIPDVPVVVGRSLEANFRVDDPWISNMHALFERRGDELWVVDLGSRNGTFVDEQPVTEAQLRPGMGLAFGRTRLELRTRAASSAVDTKAMKTPYRRAHVSVTAPNRVSRPSNQAAGEPGGEPGDVSPDRPLSARGRRR
jgi:pSer/pThr/pTyr-binding forkhead associated (FHA) protein